MSQWDVHVENTPVACVCELLSVKRADQINETVNIRIMHVVPDVDRPLYTPIGTRSDETVTRFAGTKFAHW